MRMLLDRGLYERTLAHVLNVIEETQAEDAPFPHILLQGVFPADVYERLLDSYPRADYFSKANPKHHTNEYGGSTRQRMSLNESALTALPENEHTLWATMRAVVGCRETRDAIFSKLATGLCHRFRVDRDQLSTIPAFPRGQFYSEVEGYRIAPHPDTREKIVTMQFAFPKDDSLKHVGTEFYQRSINPLNLLREPRGFSVVKSMPFLPNHAYAFSVLNEIGYKSWHGRSTIPPMNSIRNTLLHIWYGEPDESDRELVAYQQYLASPLHHRKVA
jgi:hypothetical protein